MRTNDAAAGARLQDLLRAHVVAQVEAPPNLSLFLGDDEGPVRALHRLYRGGSVVLHTRSEGRLIRAAVSYLDGQVEYAVARTRGVDIEWGYAPAGMSP